MQRFLTRKTLILVFLFSTLMGSIIALSWELRLSTNAFSVSQLEPENGVLSGNILTINDGSVSNSKYIQFAGYGPQKTIICSGVTVNPGESIQTKINANPTGTTFCIKSGTYSITAAITPKSGDIFIGEYGAILDGSTWASTDTTQGAFRSHNQDIDDVTIKNLVIRNMPMKAIHAFKDNADRWTIEHNELASNKYGLEFPNNSLVRYNYIHHNVGNASSSIPSERGGGYTSYRSNNTVIENNEIAYNGPEQKMTGTTNITFRHNFVHHNLSDGIWYDTDNTGSIIEDNTVEDQPREGIFYEISGQGIIRNNTVRRSGDAGIFISTSKDTEIYNNTLESNYRGVNYFLNCASVGGGGVGWDLANNNAHDNTVRLSTQSGSLANLLSYVGTCTSTQTAPYLGGSKNLTFQNNHYFVPSLSAKYWSWGLGQLKLWSEWQTIGNDTSGTVFSP